MKDVVEQYKNILQFLLILFISGIIGNILNMDIFEVAILFVLYYILQINDKIKGK